MIPLRDENPTSRRAVVTFLLILVNLGIYFGIQLPKSADAQTAFDYRWAAVPCEIDSGHPVIAVPVGSPPYNFSCTVEATGLTQPQFLFGNKNVWLAVLVAMFLHGSIMHVLGNMLFLWIFGNNVEDQLGPVAYLALYVVGGIVASAVHIAGNLHSATPFLGASGAIAVLMGAYIVWFPRTRVVTLIPLGFIPWIVRVPAVFVLGVWFLLQFLEQSSSGIATLAHIGGFVFGAVVAYALARLAGFPRRALRVRGA